MPKNRGGEDSFLRELDCAVIQALHSVLKIEGFTPIDSVRGMFQEGQKLFPGSSFRESNHIQICVRNHECIKGYFRPTDLEID